MKKAIGQTVRELKREVNKKVLKVPGIEQKVLDATSNESWGPHGSLLADIAQASRNYHEYQMIMAVIWKRLNDTGKNWRHVYKALIVLEYMVGHGSERVIEDIREHAYQISTLSDFQYIDSSGKDQGNNVRRKSQSLVTLVNDKERVIEVRQKAAANKDKFRNNASSGMYRPGSYSSNGPYGDRYDDDPYRSREEDRGYGREKEWGYRDDDQYNRDGDRYGRDYEDRYNRDGYRDDESRGRSQDVNDYNYGSRSRSSDRDPDRSYNDEGQHSSRGTSAKAEDPSLEGRLEQKLPEQNMGAPPSYEDAVGESESSVHHERDGETSAASGPRGSSPASDNPHQTSAPTGSSPSVGNNPIEVNGVPTTAISRNQEVEASDEFDPRVPLSAAPATLNNVEVDLLGSLSESFSSNALSLVPSASATAAAAIEGNVHLDSTASSAAPPPGSNNFDQSFEDPFGDSPFKAISSETTPSQPETNQRVEPSQSSVSDFGFGDSFSAALHSTSDASDTHSSATNSQLISQGFSAPQQQNDILADILPPAPLPGTISQQNFSAPPNSQSSSELMASQSIFAQTGQNTPQSFSAEPATHSFSVPTGQLSQQAFSAANGQPVQPPYLAPTSQHAQQPFSAHAGQPGQSMGPMYGGFQYQAGSVTSGASGMLLEPSGGNNGHMNSWNVLPQGSPAPIPSHMTPQAQIGQLPQTANYFPQHGGSSSQSPTNQAPQFSSGNFIAQEGNASTFTHQPHDVSGEKQNEFVGSLLGQGANVPNASQYAVPSTGSNYKASEPSKDKFEMKSTVWADTLSRGLVDLNISGAKINPLADIGIDFASINRKEKRMEKPTTTAVTSTVTMGKAMGSGSGVGRAGAGALRAPPNPMMGSGMGMGMGNGPAGGMGMGGYGGMSAPMGMNMGMAQGVQMQPPTGLYSGSNMAGNYNPMMGTGGYPQRPYGSYR
ncbi:clathrin interactor EPSIN 3 [Arachis stenosperma]|uniref:clathrin interactor EPSIN 3 n=1 Tax=Arachis stenosperma TaxID=217475 RepID=UPI0025ACCFFE|nr:clathrin interactor EPSIN 3 [Arachis stenosperma]